MLPKAHREPLRLSRWARSLPGPALRSCPALPSRAVERAVPDPEDPG